MGSLLVVAAAARFVRPRDGRTCCTPLSTVGRTRDSCLRSALSQVTVKPLTFLTSSVVVFFPCGSEGAGGGGDVWLHIDGDPSTICLLTFVRRARELRRARSAAGRDTVHDGQVCRV